jgi:hypothetical protein
MATADKLEDKVEKQVEAVFNDVQATAEEIRVKIHLAGMDAKAAWNKLEPKLEDAKAHAKTASKDTLAALVEVKKAFKSFAATL